MTLKNKQIPDGTFYLFKEFDRLFRYERKGHPKEGYRFQPPSKILKELGVSKKDRDVMFSWIVREKYLFISLPSKLSDQLQNNRNTYYIMMRTNGRFPGKTTKTLFDKIGFQEKDFALFRYMNNSKDGMGWRIYRFDINKIKNRTTDFKITTKLPRKNININF